MSAASDARQQQHEFLQQLLDNLPVAIAVIEGYEFRYSLANLAFRSLTGSFDTPIVGRTVLEVFPELLGQGTCARLKDVLDTGEPIHIPELSLRVRNRETWWSLHDLPLGPPGHPTAVLTMLTDITGQVAVRKRIEEFARKVRESDKRKDEFIAMLSHELRNPLAPIKYALPLVDKATLDAKARHAVAVIDRQVTHLVRLVDDLLDVSRITRGKVELRTTRVSLASIIKSALEVTSPLMHAARHQCETVLPEASIWIDADPDRMSQVITNLLTNAAKYTPRGGRIVLEATQADGEAIVRVRDNGIGIPEQALPTIFEMFHQVKRADHTQAGLGIGLALAKRLVELHGGTIEARSEGVGKGAEFVIRVPLAAGPEIGVEPATQPGGEVTRRLKVLIVDDNIDLVDMLAGFVGHHHDVRRAFDGRSAIAAARAYRPDVVLLDLGLPLMSGLEVARELRRMPETAGARLIALTGWGQPDDQRETKEAGFDCHLTKPADPETLRRLLAQLAGE